MKTSLLKSESSLVDAYITFVRHLAVLKFKKRRWSIEKVLIKRKEEKNNMIKPLFTRHYINQFAVEGSIILFMP